jgi:hypothetical protein
MRESILVMLLIGAGCASYQPPLPLDVRRSAIFESSFEDVWTRTVDYFANNNLPLRNVEKDSGLIATDYGLPVGYTELNCGKPPIGLVFAAPQVNVNVLIRAVGEKRTEVRVNVFGNGSIGTLKLNGTVDKAMDIRCESTGEIEAGVLSYLE